MSNYFNKNFCSVKVNRKKYFLSLSFKESHGHLLSMAKNFIDLDLSKNTSREGCIDAIVAYERNLPPDRWLIAFGWNQYQWSDDQKPITKIELDQIIPPNRPVVLSRIDGHCYLINQACFDRCGIDIRNPPVVEGGKFLIDEQTGLANGLCLEKAQDIIRRHIPNKIRRDEWFDALQRCENILLSMGVTSFTDAWVRDYEWEILRDYCESGRQKLGVQCFFDSRNPNFMEKRLKAGRQTITSGSGKDLGGLSAVGIKLFADGALGSRGAWMLEPYADDPQNCGIQILKDFELEQILTNIWHSGMQAAVHAIGDAANRMVLDAYESIARKYTVTAFRQRRWRIEHAQHVKDPDLKRFADLGVVAAFQAQHATSDWNWAVERLGRKRLESTGYRWKDFVEAGVKICNGSDVPIEYPDPMLALYAAITRNQPEQPLDSNKDQCLDFSTAWKAATEWPWYAVFEEDCLQQLLDGDFCIWDEDLSKLKPQELLSKRPVAVFRKGIRVAGDFDCTREDISF